MAGKNDIPRIILGLDSRDGFSREIMRGVVKYSREYGPWSFYNLDFHDRDFYYAGPVNRGISGDHKKFKASGAIITDERYYDEILSLNIPTVIVTSYRKLPKGYPYIMVNGQSVSSIAAQHFLNRGFQNFAYCGIGSGEWVSERGRYFSEEIKTKGYDTQFYEQKASMEDSQQSWAIELPLLLNWLRSLKKPVGVFACNDMRAMHILEVCKIGGMSVPEEVAVLGVDNDELVCELCQPPLSSVALNIAQGGYEAAGILDKWIRKKKPDKHPKMIHIQPTHVVERQSTDIMAIEDSEVAAALDYIRCNAKEAIQVNDVAFETGISRRTLEIRFKKVLGRSVLEEIKRTRLELLLAELRNTDLTIAAIANRLGYSSVDHISRYFRKEMGMTLRQYRKRYCSG